jgi:hypothetical protein
MSYGRCSTRGGALREAQRAQLHVGVGVLVYREVAWMNPAESRLLLRLRLGHRGRKVGPEGFERIVCRGV